MIVSVDPRTRYNFMKLRTFKSSSKLLHKYTLLSERYNSIDDIESYMDLPL